MMLVIRRCYLLLILAGLFFVVVQALMTTNRPLSVSLSSSVSTSSSLVSSKYQPLLFASFEALQKEEELFIDGKNNHNHKSMNDDDIAVSDVLGQPLYQLAGIDLSSAWITLVRRNKVSATIELPFPITKTVIDADYDDTNENKKHEEDSGKEKNSIRVEYGVRMIQQVIDDEDISTTIFPKEDKENCQLSSSSLSSKKSVWIFEEYVQQLAGRVGEEEAKNIHPLIRAMNTTLTQIQQQQQSSSNREHNANNIKRQRVGNFVAQLQLIRTLRPPPSKELLEVQHSQDDTTACSTPPLYESATDSFVTGALRLQLRPLVCQLGGVDGESDNVNGDDDGTGQPPHHVSLTTTPTTTTTTPWDVYHNVSPIDRRGHFLLLPTLSSMRDKKNWRAQSLTHNDCHDLVHLASSIEPVGSLFLGYNSIGAGASQNHIHCHAWPYPLSTTTIGATTIPSNDDNENNRIIHKKGTSSSSTNNSNSDDHSHDHNHNQDHNHECTHPDHDHDHGAQQNNNNNNNNYYDGNYAVTKVDSIYDYYDVIKRRSDGDGDGDGDGTENDIAVEVSYLNYPVFCVLLSSTVDNVEWLGKAIDTCLQTIKSVASGAAPHNIGLLNRVVDIDDDESIIYVDVYLFVRSKEQSTTFLPTMKLGISEMMGVFQAQSEEELHRLTQTTSMVEFVIDDDDGTTRIERTNKSIMEQALLDVSFGSGGGLNDGRENDMNDNNNAEDEDENDLWEKIITNLATMS